MEKIQNLVLLIDGKIVGIARRDVSEPSEDHAQFFPGIRQLGNTARLDLDFVVRPGPKRG